MKSHDLHLKSNEKVQNYPQDKHVHINDDDNEFRRKKTEQTLKILANKFNKAMCICFTNDYHDSGSSIIMKMIIIAGTV